MENKIYLNKYLPKYTENAKESIGFEAKEETRMFFDRANLYLRESRIDPEILDKYIVMEKQPEDESVPLALRKDELEVRPHVDLSLFPVLTDGLNLNVTRRIIYEAHIGNYVKGQHNIDVSCKYFYILEKGDYVALYLFLIATEVLTSELIRILTKDIKPVSTSNAFYKNTLLWRLYKDWQSFGLIAQKWGPSPKLYVNGIRNYFKSLSYTRGIPANFYRGNISHVLSYLTFADYEQLHAFSSILHHYGTFKGSGTYYGRFHNYLSVKFSTVRYLRPLERLFLADPGTKDIYDISATPSRGRLDWRMYMHYGRFLAWDAFYSPVDSVLQSELEGYKQGLDDVLVKKEKWLEPRHGDNIVFHVMWAYSLYDLEYKYDIRYYPVRSIVDNFAKYYGRPSGGYIFPDEHGHDQTRILMDQYWKSVTDFWQVNFTDRPFEHSKPNFIFPHHFTGFAGDYSTQLDYLYSGKEYLEEKPNKYKRVLGGKKNRKVSRNHPFKRYYDYGILNSYALGYESVWADILF